MRTPTDHEIERIMMERRLHWWLADADEAELRALLGREDVARLAVRVHDCWRTPTTNWEPLFRAHSEGPPAAVRACAVRWDLLTDENVAALESYCASQIAIDSHLTSG